MYQYQHVIHRMRLGDSDRQIQKAGLMGRTKASAVREKARENGWLDPLSSMPDEAVLEDTFGSKPQAPIQSKIEPYKDQVAQWFDEGIQGTTIYDALVRDYGFTGSYSCVRRYLKTLKATQIKTSIKLTFKPGESAQVDFGKGPNITDSHTSKPQKTWIFVMTLAWSRHMYAEIVPNQTVETWLGCHRRAFEFFNGVPASLRIDNLKSAITRACFYEPEVQRAYENLALGYGFKIDPCPVADPKKKGRVESGVKYVKNAFVPLRKFRSIAEGNRQLTQWVMEVAGNRIHGTTHEKPLVRFEQTERFVLHPLPQIPPELAVWNQCKLHGDCHICVDKCYYSAPYIYANQTLWVKSLEKTVYIFNGHELVATHPRLFTPGKKSTNNDHYPPEAQAYLMRDPQWCLAQAEKIGPYCREVVDELFADRVLEKLRAAQGLLSLKKKYGAKSLELACRRAVVYLSPKYQTVKSILKQGLEHEPIERQAQLPLDEVYTGQGKYTRPPTDMFQ
jgi:transposase